MLNGLSNVVLYLGIGLCLLVALRILLSCLRSCGRWRRERKLYIHEKELLQVKLQQLRKRNQLKPTEEPAWQGYRKFIVQRIVDETAGSRSLYLVPQDEKKLPPYLPGQFLTFALPVAEELKPVVRCYSLSDRPHVDYYRCTIKHLPSTEDTPQGKGSSFIHQHVHDGDTLEVKAPRGTFVLDLFDSKPVVLLAAGIGITPLLSMVSTIMHHGWSELVYLFFTVRNSEEHLFRTTLKRLAKQHSNFKLVMNYSAPLSEDQEGVDYHYAGRLQAEQLWDVLPSSNFQFYICGPGGYVQNMTETLGQMNVPSTDIHTESFGPSSRSAPVEVGDTTAVKIEKTQALTSQVQFKQSGLTLDWDPNQSSLLDFAESNDVPIDSSCRSGSCGTCATKICAGKVQYPDDPTMETDSDECLPCIAVPNGQVTLDV